MSRHCLAGPTAPVGSTVAHGLVGQDRVCVAIDPDCPLTIRTDSGLPPVCRTSAVLP